MTPRTSKVKEKVGSDTVLDSTPWWAQRPAPLKPQTVVQLLTATLQME